MKNFAQRYKLIMVMLAELFLLQSVGCAESETTTDFSSGIPYATHHVILDTDSEAVIIEKAAKVLPRPIQTNWFRMERTFFIHFGPNTFNHVEWGSGREDASIFNPTKLDAEKWVIAVKEAGGKMIVPVCKHHDGFSMWPTRYETHSVAASPWRDGKGDLIRDIADAAKKHGIKMGIYLSPADLYQLMDNPKNPDGYYGNNSPARMSVIPTDPASLTSDPMKGRTPPEGCPTFTYELDDYNRYYLNQLYELLTEYGPIYQINIDGANPRPGTGQEYAYPAWYDMIRHLQPEMVITVKGPDGRWVGNEGGVGRTTEWSVIPLPEAPEEHDWPDRGQRDLGSRSKLKPGSHLWWYPAETNMPILHGWFWAPGKPCRSASDLVNTYYQSVGRNGIWLLNLSPDSDGVIPEDQLTNLRLSTQVIEKTFKKNLAAKAKVTADTSNASHKPSQVLDGDLDTWWEAAAGHSTAAITLTMPDAVTFDVVSLQEAVDHRSQRIESFVIEAWDGSDWTPARHIRSDELTTVGFKRLIRLREPVTTDRIRIRITGSRTEPTFAELGLYKQSDVLMPPAISDRDTNGIVTIKNDDGFKMVYTLDGSLPKTDSSVYSSPISLPNGGTVQAACVLSDGQLGLAATKSFAGLAPIGWKVVKVDSEETEGEDNSAANAIDDNSNTFWHTRWNSDQQLPHFITVDMGKTQRIAGLSYLPRQDGNLNGTVVRYRFETSENGTDWTTRIDSGRFGNMQNNPTLQVEKFAPVNARYFRFTALREIWSNGWTSAAEISVLPATAE